MAEYYLVDIDGTLTDYHPGAFDDTVGGNFLFPIIRDMLTERGLSKSDAESRIIALANSVLFWDYTDFIAEFSLPAEEAFRRMKEWHREHLFYYPENVELVKQLHREGKKLLIMSNNPYIGCIFKLQVAGLADDDFSSRYFSRILGTVTLRGCKNSTDVWRRAFALIPAPIESIGVIGDNPKEDGELPRSLGVKETIIIERKEIARGIDR